MHVIFGLGNPGQKYRLTRHNIGFILLDYISSFFKIPFSPGKGDYYFCEVQHSGQSFLLIKPTTYMNLSGRAVLQVIEEFVVDPGKIMVVYDDFHLPFGALRFRAKGSSGGHNGIESVIEHLQTDTFSRLKFGIGSEFSDSIDFVLSEFTKEQLADLDKLLKTAFEGLTAWMGSGIEQAMNLYNRNYGSTNENKSGDVTHV